MGARGGAGVKSASARPAAGTGSMGNVVIAAETYPPFVTRL
jgi:hypothetical protein